VFWFRPPGSTGYTAWLCGHLSSVYVSEKTRNQTLEIRNGDNAAAGQSEQRHLIPQLRSFCLVPRAIWQLRQGLGRSLMVCYGWSETIGTTGTLERLELALA
jgi:hypothetical protein